MFFKLNGKINGFVSVDRRWRMLRIGH